MFGFFANFSCPNCNSYRLKRIHRLPWMKKISDSILCKCRDCDRNFLFWGIFYLEIKKVKNKDELVASSQVVNIR